MGKAHRSQGEKNYMKTKHQKIIDRQDALKEEFIVLIQKTPIVQIVCERIGIARSTYYRWLKEDSSFSTKVTLSEHEGRVYVNDAIESKLIQKAKDGDMTAIIYYLKNNHPRYCESWGGIHPDDITRIAEYIRNANGDTSHDSEFIASLFQKRIPHSAARLILKSMRHIEKVNKEAIDMKKFELLSRLQEHRN